MGSCAEGGSGLNPPGNRAAGLPATHLGFGAGGSRMPPPALAGRLGAATATYTGLRPGGSSCSHAASGPGGTASRVSISRRRPGRRPERQAVVRFRVAARATPRSCSTSAKTTKLTALTPNAQPRLQGSECYRQRCEQDLRRHHRGPAGRSGRPPRRDRRRQRRQSPDAEHTAADGLTAGTVSSGARRGGEAGADEGAVEGLLLSVEALTGADARAAMPWAVEPRLARAWQPRRLGSHRWRRPTPRSSAAAV
jgi:hypothetical protein